MLAAVKSGSLEEVKRLLELKHNINERDPRNLNQTVLHIAASQGQEKIVSLLVQKGKKIDLNIQDDHGWTPLLCAINGSHYEICEILLNHKLIKILPNNKNINPLMLLCTRRINDENQFLLYRFVLKLLLIKGCDVNERNNKGETAAHFAAMVRNQIAIDFLGENNTNFNAITKYV